ncbi:MAG: methionyl-tRNA formyltransferase [Eubacteriales bacterium]|nr:methionyl-tRNA formyltransferase [Eubacteriales bacterium]
MKTVFMGTGPFAAKALETLYSSEHAPVMVVTQPDRPNSRRGGKIVFGEVKQFALERGIPLLQPEKVSTDENAAILASTGAQCAVVCSFGQLLKKNILFDTFEYGCINIHASLLESYRGAAPINRAIMNGETVCGVTIMYMDEGLDTGDMMIKDSTPVSDGDTFGTLSERLSLIGGDLAVKALDLLQKGEAPRTPQDDSRSSYAAKILKADKHVDLTRSARSVFNHIRGMDPSPAAECTFDSRTVKLFSCEIASEHSEGNEGPGTILKGDKRGIYIQCGDGVLLIKTLKPEGKGLMEASSFYNGIKNRELKFS